MENCIECKGTGLASETQLCTQCAGSGQGSDAVTGVVVPEKKSFFKRKGK